MANEETIATENTTVETTDATEVADAAPAADSTTDTQSVDQTAQSLVSNDIDAIDAPANEQVPAPAESAPIEAPATEVAPTEAPVAFEAPARSNAPQPELNDSLSPLAGMENQERKEVEGGRSYEIIFIVRPGDAEAIEATTQRVRTLIEGEGGALDNVRVSEARRLAYVIDKESEGIYIVVNARFSKDLTSEIDRFFKLEESVLRHMTLRQED